ncbi:MAG: hypothetical protein HC929_10315 [Leptolyngbyaceae cyanobacterium SM2_5_2]|nr:hypothetical protein [Leptolyngbyaceae cyanobacterium SM2_5_2]
MNEWMAQINAQPVAQGITQITGIQINPTDAGLEVVLESTGNLATPSSSTVGNALVAEISNAVLALPQDNASEQIWIQEGWDWLNYLKQGETLALSDPDADYPDWAEVQIHFCSPYGNYSGTYEARIESYREVETMWNSGDSDSIESIKQYQVSHLKKLL